MDTLKTTEINSQHEPATHAVIWLHGLGASGDDLAGLHGMLPKTSALAVNHLFPNAPLRAVTINNNFVMPAWYDILTLSITDREDAKGLEESRLQVEALIAQVEANGIASSNIILAGFSQGGAVAIYTALLSEKRFAGVISMHGYLPLAAQFRENELVAKQQPKLLITAGTEDDIVQLPWVKASKRVLLSFGCTDLTFESFASAHTIDMAEIQCVDNWIATCFA